MRMISHNIQWQFEIFSIYTYMAFYITQLLIMALMGPKKKYIRYSDSKFSTNYKTKTETNHIQESKYFNVKIA